MDVRIRLLLALLAALLVPAAALAAAEPDTTFRGDGTVVTDVDHDSPDYANAVILQPDGKIVAVGAARGPDGRFALVRYNVDGSRDHTFGGDGIVLTNFTDSDDAGEAIVRQANGKLIAAGFVPTDNRRFALARYKPDGSLDRSYGRSGRVLTDFTPGDLDGAFAAALQPDGKLVAAGWAGGNGGRFAAARYLKNGTLDATFGAGGKVTVNFTKARDAALDVAVDGAGHILVAGVAGASSNVPGASARFALVRLRPDGARDPTFGGDGRVMTDFFPDDSFAGDSAAAVKVQPDGKIVAVGGGPGEWTAARYKEDGTLDSSFGAGGKASYSFSGADYESAADVELDGTGFLVLADGNQLARLDSDGDLDTTFAPGGRIGISFGNRFFDGRDIAIAQGDGKIVIAGSVNGKKFAVTRRLP